MEEKNKENSVNVDINQLMELCLKAKKEQGGDDDENAEKINRPIFEVSYISIFKALLKNWWVLLLATVICAIGVFIYSYNSMEILYNATAKMYVNNESVSVGAGSSKIDINQQSVSMALSLIPSYLEIIRSKSTLETVRSELYEKYGYELTVYQLLEMISGGAIDDTVFFYVRVTNADPQMAIRVVNVVVDVLPDQISSVFDGASARVVDNASEAIHYSTSVKRPTFFGALIGLLIAVTTIILKDCVFNDVIDSSEWLGENFESIPVLGEIPNVGEIGNNGNNRYSYKYSHYYYYRTSDKAKSKK